ncbi:gluconate 2-dehydrogenase subunit 3 family protein [Marinimicrobium alkaliphilum]|uniref:gluconate 2-dehydrogenase subunit 3 family protein n=1 Tax=Marinimicrobium alkaliphilum TaxID=2202654 RepID=UPI000DB91145|nr:gluconate 2-dehydrogenase subunit 3 family protein [Marinimicrobium alkaliphilum]
MSQSTFPSNANRRTALKQLALACGVLLSGRSLDLLAANIALPQDQTRRQQRLLDEPQRTLVAQLGELIIPTTDTPGAIAAGVHEFIDHQLAYCASRDEQRAFLDGLRRVEQVAQRRHDQPFLACDQDQQVALLRAMEAADEPFTGADRAFFRQLKGLVLLGYYTSEVGATQELAYAAVPGDYRPITFEEVGRAWSNRAP